MLLIAIISLQAAATAEYTKGGIVMSDRCFPANEYEALAYLYVQSQDLTGLKPADIYKKYCDAYKEIYAAKDNKLPEAKIFNSPV